ncbi:MAG: alanine racemase [Dermabacter sp.]|nr:alanine racemase [Dermabacter sp.]
MARPGSIAEAIQRCEDALDAAGLSGRPVAVLDLDAFDANARDLARRARRVSVRVASKSLRVMALIRRASAQLRGGVLAYSLAEALDQSAHGIRDIVVAYPCVNASEIARLAADPEARDHVSLMVDSLAHARLLAHAARPSMGVGKSLRVVIDLDVSYAPTSGIHLGARRSPLRTPAQARTLAREISQIPELRLVGLMGYEGQIAGVASGGFGPARLATRAMQAVSGRELNRRRAACVAAIAEVCPLEFVNGGGTGSIESTIRDASVTEVAAGSGLVGPTLFDSYARFRPEPALFLGFPVVRRPAPSIATVAGGGWIASGPVGADRSPLPVHPPGLHLLPLEGAGEVQTPVAGPAAAHLRLGDTVWMRHAKAGEPAEHVNEYVLISGGEVVDVVPTYRGDGRVYI